jgi:hypothetical protein
MKFKKDFITNSSSTSFVGWGISLEIDEIKNEKELLELAYKEYKNSYMTDDDTYNFEKFMDENEEENFRDAIDGLFPYKKSLLQISFGPNGDDIMIAGPVSGLKDDQTLRDYKKQIIEELGKVGIRVSAVSYIEESWYNG